LKIHRLRWEKFDIIFHLLYTFHYIITFFLSQFNFAQANDQLLNRNIINAPIELMDDPTLRHERGFIVFSLYGAHDEIFPTC